MKPNKLHTTSSGTFPPIKTRYKLLLASDGTLLLISRIESMKFVDDDEADRVMNAISDNMIVEIIMKSGKDHTVYLRDMVDSSTTISQLRSDIIGSWLSERE